MAITIEEHASPADGRLFTLNIHEDSITVTVNFTRRILSATFVVALGVTGIFEAETLQVCIRNQCLVFQLSQAPEVPNSLRNFLMDDANIFVGFNSYYHPWKLWNSRHQLSMFGINPLDITHFPRTIDGRHLVLPTIEEIARDCLGIHGVTTSRRVTWSNWAVQHLAIQQVQQVALEAYITYRYGWMVMWG